MKSAVRNAVSAIGVVAALVTAAVPAFAAPPGSSGEQQSPTAVPSSARGAAIRDCSMKASKWSNSAWENTQILTYGSCMAGHGQME